jgi:hypothetical protein
MFFKPKIERDPNIQKLEQDVFAKIQEIVKPVQSNQEQTTTNVQFISFEDAIREIAQMNK